MFRSAITPCPPCTQTLTVVGDIGIDLISNWGYKWRPGRATSPCSDSYPGTSAFEAFETRAMANYLANGTTWCPNCTSSAPVHEPGDDKGKPPKRRVRAFVDLHSYGQLCKPLRSPLHTG